MFPTKPCTNTHRRQMDSQATSLVPLSAVPRTLREEEKRTTIARHTRWVGQYQTGRTIGKGGCGKVRHAKFVPTNEAVALKVFAPEQADVDKVLREVEMLVKCHDHPNIPTCFDVFRCKDKLYVAMQRATGKDLFERVLANGPLTVKHTKAIMRVLVGTVAFLHERNIAHRDVKPENVLLGDDPSQTLLYDFGYAIEWDKAVDKPLTRACGTIRCLPPEAFVVTDKATQARSYDPQALDVFGLGNVMFFMLTGRFPFEAREKGETAANVVHGRFVAPFPADLPAEADSFLSSLLERDPKKRPSASELLSHEFLARGGKRSM